MRRITKIQKKKQQQQIIKIKKKNNFNKLKNGSITCRSSCISTAYYVFIHLRCPDKAYARKSSFYKRLLI